MSLAASVVLCCVGVLVLILCAFHLSSARFPVTAGSSLAGGLQSQAAPGWGWVSWSLISQLLCFPNGGVSKALPWLVFWFSLFQVQEVAVNVPARPLAVHVSLAEDTCLQSNSYIVLVRLLGKLKFMKFTSF